ncbi:MAG: FadR/GntR family transcriptional regulator, partial [Roseburia sp.]
MEFHKLEAPSLKELFITQLEDMILSGQLKVGQKLPSERELASSMQVSRAVVNSGIAEMEKKGFLVVKPRIGTFVEDYRKNGTLETLVSIMNYNGGVLQESDIRSLLEMRIILTSLSATLAIEHATDEELHQLSRFLEQLKKETNADTAASLVFDFYHEL